MDEIPAINATLNAISTALLVGGFVMIRKKNITVHRALMISAFIVSILFLVGYVLHKVHLVETTGAANTTFQGEGIWRIVYFAILIPHVILAAFVPFLAGITLFRGAKMQVEKHRKIARITLPIWLFVSVTGVLVYYMLYQWFPGV